MDVSHLQGLLEPIAETILDEMRQAVAAGQTVEGISDEAVHALSLAVSAKRIADALEAMAPVTITGEPVDVCERVQELLRGQRFTEEQGHILQRMVEAAVDKRLSDVNRRVI